MHIENAQISMPAEKSGGGDYASQGNQDTNLRINKANIHLPDSTGGGGGDYASQGNQDTNVRINKAHIQMEDSTGESGIQNRIQKAKAVARARDYLLNRRRLVPVIEANDYRNYGGK